MDLTKILGSLIASGALSKGSGGDVLGSLVGAALGGSQNQQTQGGGVLGDILGSVLGGGQSSTSGSAGGLGDLLGAVLGGSSKSTSATTGGLGDILGSLIGGATSGEQRQSKGNSSSSASDLEDLLGVGKNANTGGFGGAGGLGGLLGGALAKYGQQNNPNIASHAHDNCDHLPIGMDHHQANDQATLIIRAMINAAKSDGSIDQSEQDKVIAKLGDVTQEEINFIKAEFAAPLDVKAFVRSIPRGMEQQIYTVSLMAIDLDQNAEAHYLASLVQELNISHQAANQLHVRLGAPKIFA